ncbi:MAG: VCBS repeat-containing protein [Candidatus Hydrogenedentes bacterium]|nr:VCBS repeat-containing protein [Candidatus Hydrogenedentota bacterium]
MKSFQFTGSIIVTLISGFAFADLALAVDSDIAAEVSPGWSLETVAEVDQSYAGWDVEIGDADNDGKNEILTTGCPDSRLYLFKKTEASWETRMLAENLANQNPGMGLSVRAVDLNHDGKKEIILGTGEERGGTAFLYLLETDGRAITRRVVSRPEDINKSSFTHNLAVHDLDNDGADEVISAYCGGGEVIRYDFDAALSKVEARKVYHLSGSGEESIIADVDNDGSMEYVTSNSFRTGKARVEIFEFDANGELMTPPRVAIEGYGGIPCFYASFMVGDINNDGKNELVVGWKREQAVNKTTLLAYRVAEVPALVATLEIETEDLDMAYFEKMMAVADADNDGRDELLVSTRGDASSENITSGRLGRVYRYNVDGVGNVKRELLADFDPAYAESTWLAVGDADNDGRNEIVLATGKGDRTQPGTSHVVILRTTH